MCIPNGGAAYPFFGPLDSDDVNCRCRDAANCKAKTANIAPEKIWQKFFYMPGQVTLRARQVCPTPCPPPPSGAVGDGHAAN
jgi:hypothetical protein